MNMTRDVFLFTLHEGSLVRVKPTEKELLMGRRMAATLTNMCRVIARTGRAHSEDTSIGRIEISPLRKKRKQELIINTIGGELSYEEVRTFLLIATQYSCGEFPMLVVSFDGLSASICLNSGKDIVQEFAR